VREPASHPVPLRLQLTPNWAITLNEQFLKDETGKSLRLFNERLQIWIRSYLTPDGPAILDRMETDAARAPANAADFVKGVTKGIGQVSYVVPASRLDDGKTKAPSLFTYSHGSQSQIMIVFDHKGPSSLKAAQDIFASLEYIDA
jgi:hypothetical protein